MGNRIRRLRIITEGPNQGKSYVLQNNICTLGRTANNTIVIDNPRISRQHTKIHLLPDRAIVEDMGSTNGTRLNGHLLTEPQPLMPGDVISLADCIAFRFEAEASTWTEKPTGATTAPAAENISLLLPPDDAAEQQRRYLEAETPYSSLLKPMIVNRQEPVEQAEPEEMAVPADLKPSPAASRWHYVLIAVLLILICACAAMAAYLWFAPVEFWQKIFRLFNIPLP